MAYNRTCAWLNCDAPAVAAAMYEIPKLTTLDPQRLFIANLCSSHWSTSSPFHPASSPPIRDSRDLKPEFKVGHETPKPQ